MSAEKDEKQRIKQYCRSLDIDDFTKLSQKTQDLFLKTSLVALKNHVGNKKVAKAVLSHYNLNDKGKPLEQKKLIDQEQNIYYQLLMLM